MSAQTEAAGQPSERAGEPSEEQLRAAYEAELSRIKSVDMVLQAAASLLNIGAHRLGLTGAPAAQGAERQLDLEQVRDAIDAVRGLLPVIERSAPAELRPLRDALSQLQMAYSREIQAAPAAQGAPGGAQPEPGASSEGPARAGRFRRGARRPATSRGRGGARAGGRGAGAAGQAGSRPGGVQRSAVGTGPLRPGAGSPGQ